MSSKIRLMALDVDGVLTDGKLTLDADGKEYKTFDFKDFDAVYLFYQKGLQVALITGESGPLAEALRDRLSVNYFFPRCHDKAPVLQKLLEETGIPAAECCYVGDGICDVPALKLAGYSAAPANAIDEAKAAAKIQLSRCGGDGCLWELLRLLEAQGIL